MKRRWLGWSMSTLLLACAGPAQVRETVSYSRVAPSGSSARATRTKTSPARKATGSTAASSPKTGDEATPARKVVTPGRPTHAASVSGAKDAELIPGESDAEREERLIDVGGIEGTMSEYDIKATMDSRSGDFDRCHDTSSGSGRIKFRIRILPNGDVSDVNVRQSSVRNRELVGCYSEVIMASRFPSPHGGYADVTWATKVGRSRKKPDEFFERKVRWDSPATSSSSGSYVSGSSDRDESRRERRRRRHSRRHRSDG